MAAPVAVETSGFSVNEARRYFLLIIRVAADLWQFIVLAATCAALSGPGHRRLT